MTRLLDIILSAPGLVLLSPVFLSIAVLIKLSDRGPVFHRATRVGKDGRLFRLVKFRTMVVAAEQIGPGITMSGDPRVTPIGRWLRRSKLDELPQLMNVLAGDMSLVGPRPEDPRYVALYTDSQCQLLRVRPGITSAASLVYRHEEQILSGPDWESLYRDHILPHKLALDLDYLSRRSLWTDLGIIFRTIASVFRR